MKKYNYEDILNFLKNNDIEDLYYYLMAHGAQIYNADTLNKLILALLNTLFYVERYYTYGDNLKAVFIEKLKNIIDIED